MSNKGQLLLVPTPLGDYDPALVLTASVLEQLSKVGTFVVEDLRSARRFLSRAGFKGRIEGLRMVELNEHSRPGEAEAMESLFDGGNDVALISEAGLPAVADPGADLVAMCHRKGIKVVPLVGPSSLMLSLMASGLNGQSFAFNGYLPAKTDQRHGAIKSAEKISADRHQTQIFIETPYRNDALLSDLVKNCSPRTRLCIAANLTLEDETVITKTIAEWRQTQFTIGKRPCVFLILA